MTPANPWYHANERGRKYLTPEDITAAIAAGGEKLEVWQVVLEALGKRVCEDWSLCAFVAHHHYEKKDNG